MDFLETATNKKALLVVSLILVKLREVYLVIAQVEVFLVIIKKQKVQGVFLVIIKKQKVQIFLEINLLKTKELLVYLVILEADFLEIIKIKKLKNNLMLVFMYMDFI